MGDNDELGMKLKAKLHPIYVLAFTPHTPMLAFKVCTTIFRLDILN